MSDDRLSAAEDRLVEAEVDLRDLEIRHAGVLAVASNLDAQVKRLSRQMAEREAEILSLNDRLGILLSSRGELLGRLDELERWHRTTQTHEGKVE